MQTLRQTTEAEQSLNSLLTQCSQLQQHLAARVQAINLHIHEKELGAMQLPTEALKSSESTGNFTYKAAQLVKAVEQEEVKRAIAQDNQTKGDIEVCILKLTSLRGDLIDKLKSIVQDSKAKYQVLKTLVEHVLTSDIGSNRKPTAPSKAPKVAMLGAKASPRRSPTTASAPASACDHAN